jgi:hypothetical protein
MADFKRETAINSVTRLIENLPQHADYPIDAIRMIDREIGGLLAHPASPFCNDYRSYSITVFPSGLEATLPGYDIILILNSKKIAVKHKGKSHNINIPLTLKHPEKGVAYIIGHTLALSLFRFRREVLIKLQNKHGEKWAVNYLANDVAIGVLNSYMPNQIIYSKKSGKAKHTMFVDRAKQTEESDRITNNTEVSWLSRICPCIS